MRKQIDYKTIIEAEPGTEFEKVFKSHVKAHNYQLALLQGCKRHGIKIKTEFKRNRKFPHDATIKYTKLG